MVAIEEAGRLDALRRYRILDTDPEQAFDDLTLLASQVCGTPIALISLVDDHRQWFKSRVGLEAQETSRRVSFCAHAIAQPGLFVVPDALDDARLCDNPLVLGDPLRFYAGLPLRAREGEALGTLCVIDRRPRSMTADQQEVLEALRRQAWHERAESQSHFDAAGRMTPNLKGVIAIYEHPRQLLARLGPSPLYTDGP